MLPVRYAPLRPLVYNRGTRPLVMIREALDEFRERPVGSEQIRPKGIRHTLSVLEIPGD